MPASPRLPRYRVVLIAVDFSPASQSALDRGFDLARRVGARVELVHVSPRILPSLPFSRANRATAERLHREAAAEAKRVLASLVPAKAGVAVHPKVLRGRPDLEILAHARRVRADLIVLANRGHGIAETLLLGSTAESVLRRATLPVLLVPAARPHRRARDARPAPARSR